MDRVPPGSDPLCRMCINTHLIKRGLVFVDRESDYREKKRFIKLAGSFVS